MLKRILAGVFCAALSAQAAALEPSPVLFHTDNITYSGLKGSYRIALTFDDGPSAVTPQVLDVLAAYGVKATFFILGDAARRNPYFMERIRDEGHLIANHSNRHPRLSKRLYVRHPARLIKEIGTSHDHLSPYLQPGQALFFRAPYGAWRSAHAAVLNADPVLRRYIGPIFWDVGGASHWRADGTMSSAADWRCWSRKVSAETCAGGYVSETVRHRGGVVLMHDLRSQARALTAYYVPAMLALGYRFIRLDQVPAYDRYRAPEDEVEPPIPPGLVFVSGRGGPAR